eukprot:jgi/Galph1/5535/GphlegSOOS_G4169.1
MSALRDLFKSSNIEPQDWRLWHSVLSNPLDPRLKTTKDQQTRQQLLTGGIINLGGSKRRVAEDFGKAAIDLSDELGIGELEAAELLFNVKKKTGFLGIENAFQLAKQKYLSSRRTLMDAILDILRTPLTEPEQEPYFTTMMHFRDVLVKEEILFQNILSRLEDWMATVDKASLKKAYDWSSSNVSPRDKSITDYNTAQLYSNLFPEEPYRLCLCIFLICYTCQCSSNQVLRLFHLVQRCSILYCIVHGTHKMQSLPNQRTGNVFSCFLQEIDQCLFCLFLALNGALDRSRVVQLYDPRTKQTNKNILLSDANFIQQLHNEMITNTQLPNTKDSTDDAFVSINRFIGRLFLVHCDDSQVEEEVEKLVEMSFEMRAVEFLTNHLGEFLSIGGGLFLEDIELLRDSFAELVCDLLDISDYCYSLGMRCREAVVQLVNESGIDYVEPYEMERTEVPSDNQQTLRKAYVISDVLSMTGKTCQICPTHSYRLWNAQSGTFVSFCANVVVEIGDLVERNSELFQVGPVFLSTLTNFFHLLKHFAASGREMSSLVLNFLSHSGHPFASLERVYQSLKYYSTIFSSKEYSAQEQSTNVLVMSNAESLTLSTFVDILNACAQVDEQMLLATLADTNLQDWLVISLQLILMEIPANLKASLIHLLANTKSDRLSFQLIEHLFGNQGIGIRREINHAAEYTDSFKVVCAMIYLARLCFQRWLSNMETIETEQVEMAKMVTRVIIRVVIASWRKMEYGSYFDKWQLALESCSLLAVSLSAVNVHSPWFSVVQQVYSDICQSDNMFSLGNNCFHNIIHMLSCDGKGSTAMDDFSPDAFAVIMNTICTSCYIIERLVYLFKSRQLALFSSSVCSLSDLVASECSQLVSLLDYIGLDMFPFSSLIHSASATLCACASVCSTLVYYVVSSSNRKFTRSVLYRIILRVDELEALSWDAVEMDVWFQSMVSRNNKLLESLLYFVFYALGSDCNEEGGLYLLGFDHEESMEEGVFAAVVQLASKLLEKRTLSDRNLAVALAFLSLLCNKSTTFAYACRYLGLNKNVLLVPLLRCYANTDRQIPFENVSNKESFVESFSSALRLIALVCYDATTRTSEEQVFHIETLQMPSSLLDLFSFLTKMLESGSFTNAVAWKSLFSSWYSLLVAVFSNLDGMQTREESYQTLSSLVLRLADLVSSCLSKPMTEEMKLFVEDTCVQATLLFLLKHLYHLSVPRLNLFCFQNTFIVAAKALILWIVRPKEITVDDISLWTSTCLIFEYFIESSIGQSSAFDQVLSNARQIIQLLSQHSYYSFQSNLEVMVDALILEYLSIHKSLLREYSLNVGQVLKKNGRLGKLLQGMLSSGRFRKGLYQSLVGETYREELLDGVEERATVRYSRRYEAYEHADEGLAVSLFDSLVSFVKSLAFLNDMGLLIDCSFPKHFLSWMEIITEKGQFSYGINIRMATGKTIPSNGFSIDELLVHSDWVACVETSISMLCGMVECCSAILCHSINESMSSNKPLLDCCLSCLSLMESSLRQVVRNADFSVYLSNLHLLESLGWQLVLFAPVASTSPTLSNILRLCFEVMFQCCQHRDEKQLKSLFLHIEGSYVPRIQPTDAVQLARNQIFHPENGSLLERDYLIVRARCRWMYLFLLHLFPNLWNYVSLTVNYDDRSYAANGFVTSVAQISSCVYAAFAEMKFFDEESEKIQAYAKDTNKQALFVEYALEEFSVEQDDPTVLLTVLQKAAASSKTIADTCFAALETGLAILDRLLDACRKQHDNEPDLFSRNLNYFALDASSTSFSYWQKSSPQQMERSLIDARDEILPFCQQLESAPRSLWKNRDVSFLQATCRHIRVILSIH